MELEMHKFSARTKRLKNPDRILLTLEYPAASTYHACVTRLIAHFLSLETDGVTPETLAELQKESEKDVNEES